MMTKEERCDIYEKFFHRINMMCISMNGTRISDAISLIDSWSYAHRTGNGEYTEEEQQQIVERVIERMSKF